MAYVQRIPVRFDDVDFARIVYFPRLFGYCHWVFEDFFGREVGIPYAELLSKKKIGFPTVDARAQFKAPLRFGDTCRVEMEAVKLGNSSLTCRFRLYLGESKKLCAEIELVTVCTQLEKMKPLKVPENLRVAFLNHLEGYRTG